MSVSIVFEVQTTPDEPLHKMLSEIDALPHWERQMMIARVMDQINALMDQGERSPELLERLAEIERDEEADDALSTGEFAHLERLFAEATAAVKAARVAERSAFQALHEARCNAEFGPAPRAGMWRCTLQDGHDDDCSNVFSRGEA